MLWGRLAVLCVGAVAVCAGGCARDPRVAAFDQIAVGTRGSELPDPLAVDSGMNWQYDWRWEHLRNVWVVIANQDGIVIGKVRIQMGPQGGASMSIRGENFKEFLDAHRLDDAQAPVSAFDRVGPSGLSLHWWRGVARALLGWPFNGTAKEVTVDGARTTIADLVEQADEGRLKGLVIVR